MFKALGWFGWVAWLKTPPPRPGCGVWPWEMVFAGNTPTHTSLYHLLRLMPGRVPPVSHPQGGPCLVLHVFLPDYGARSASSDRGCFWGRRSLRPRGAHTVLSRCTRQAWSAPLSCRSSGPSGRIPVVPAWPGRIPLLSDLPSVAILVGLAWGISKAVEAPGSHSGLQLIRQEGPIWKGPPATSPRSSSLP